mmetsp:Transcript_41228/g.81092  ORF Transcript_41228/g.81092 Transcript_41228/m.81092 type:complete len:247 (+) Transcript_41228:59-799(+)
MMMIARLGGRKVFRSLARFQPLQRPSYFSTDASSSGFDNTGLKSVEWWQKFYSKKGNSPFDWFEADQELVFEHLTRASSTNPSSNILHLGCGTSTWCELLEDAFPSSRVTHLDVSELAVQTVKKRLPGKAIVVCADARSLPFPDAELDLVVDKGAIDVFLVSGMKEDASRVLSEVARVLRPGGVYFQITAEPPELRIPSLEDAAGFSTQRSVVLEIFGASRASCYHAYMALFLLRGWSGGLLVPSM